MEKRYNSCSIFVYIKNILTNKNATNGYEKVQKVWLITYKKTVILEKRCDVLLAITNLFESPIHDPDLLSRELGLSAEIFQSDRPVFRDPGWLDIE